VYNNAGAYAGAKRMGSMNERQSLEKGLGMKMNTGCGVEHRGVNRKCLLCVLGEGEAVVVSESRPSSSEGISDTSIGRVKTDPRNRQNELG
jgi:hypothetical protein